MTKASNAEPASSEIGGGPVSPFDRLRACGRRAVNGGVRADGQETVPPQDRKSSLSLWLWVAAGFLLLVIGWAVLFTVARSAKIESVPLTTSGGGAR